MACITAFICEKTLIAASGLSQHYLNGLSDFAWFLKLISSVLWPGNNSITISFFCRMKIYALKLLSLQITEFQFLFFFFFFTSSLVPSHWIGNTKKTEIKYEKFNFSGRWHFSMGSWPKKAAKQNKHKMLSSQLHENYKHCRRMGRMYVKLCTIALWMEWINIANRNYRKVEHTKFSAWNFKNA